MELICTVTDCLLPPCLFLSDSKEAGTDNRNILDDGKSQKLTREDIESLKEQGLKGQVQEHSETQSHKWEQMLSQNNNYRYYEHSI